MVCSGVWGEGGVTSLEKSTYLDVFKNELDSQSGLGKANPEYVQGIG